MLQTLFHLDGTILLWIQENLRLEILDPFVIFFTTLGNHGMLWIVFCLALLFHSKTRMTGFIGLLALGIGALFTNVTLKPILVRPRPYITLEKSLPLILSGDPNSFPSGHTCAAFAVASAFYYDKRHRQLTLTFLGIAAFMGYSRLYVGVHYPLDVFAGTLIGWFSGWLAVILHQKARLIMLK